MQLRLFNRPDCQGATVFCSLAALDPRVGHTMDVLSSPACTWHCSLHYLFLHATLLENEISYVV